MADEDKMKLPTAVQIADDVSFTEATLDDNMIRQSALYAYYGQRVAEAQFESDNSKQILEIVEAQQAKILRDEAAETGSKLTEKAIEQELALNTKVMAARKKYNQAKADAEAMKSVLEALRHKRDMMIQFGVSRRLEIESKVSSLARVDAQTERDRESRQAARDAAAKLAKAG